MRLGIPILFLMVAFTDPLTGEPRIEEARYVGLPERGAIVIELCDGTRLVLAPEAFYGWGTGDGCPGSVRLQALPRPGTGEGEHDARPTP